MKGEYSPDTHQSHFHVVRVITTRNRLTMDEERDRETSRITDTSRNINGSVSSNQTLHVNDPSEQISSALQPSRGISHLHPQLSSHDDQQPALPGSEVNLPLRDSANHPGASLQFANFLGHNVQYPHQVCPMCTEFGGFSSPYCKATWDASTSTTGDICAGSRNSWGVCSSPLHFMWS